MHLLHGALGYVLCACMMHTPDEKQGAEWLEYLNQERYRVWRKKHVKYVSNPVACR